RKKWVLEISELHNKENTPASSLAVGYKQRLALGCAVIHEPKIVFLDEPTGGVDPISRRRFWDLINDLSEKGTTVFVTTHYLDEAEFCNRIILIDEGKLIANGSPDELKKKYITNPVIELNTDDIYKTLEILEQEYYPGNISIFGNSLHVTLNESHSTDTENEIKIISDTIKNHSIVRINSIQRIEPSLEDVFMNLLEKKASDVK
ncbi:MAG: ABC transporter ATP-binding protein, partial [Ignavibacteria bacterium]